MAEKKKWIQEAIKKPGALRKSLHVKEGEKIPADKLKKAGIQFVIEPYIRFKGEVGEQATMFFLDPSGNAIEFKAMAHPDRLFAK